MQPGKSAPEINGKDFEGNPLKLSEFRGKVVVVAFWASWCGPCIAQIPHERALVKRMEGKPFAFLGVNCDREANVGREILVKEKMNWPNWYDGSPDTGPIAGLYHVRSFPTIYVIDQEGFIRFRGVRGEALDKAVDSLMSKN